MRGIKSMQVYSWKRMECTSGLARFIEFNFSDQHAICLNSRKREFEGSVTQTFVCRGRRGMWFGGGLAEPEVQSSLLESHPSCSSVRCAIWICATCWGRSRIVVVELDSSPPHLFLYLFYSSKSRNKQGLYRFWTPGSLNFIQIKSEKCLKHQFFFWESGLSPGSALFMVAISTMWVHPAATLVM